MWTEYQHLAAAVDAPRTDTRHRERSQQLVGRPSFVFGLVGPSAVVDTACSSSLVAARMATRAVAAGKRPTRTREAVHASRGHVRRADCPRSPPTDGVKPDAAADGYGRGDEFAAASSPGTRRRRSRRRRSDSVRCCPREPGRSSSTSRTVRSLATRWPRRFSRRARTPRPSASAHGTGTSLGDPIEFAAAGRAHGASASLSSRARVNPSWVCGGRPDSPLCFSPSPPRTPRASLRHCRNLNPHVAAGLASSATSGGRVRRDEISLARSRPSRASKA